MIINEIDYLLQKFTKPTNLHPKLATFDEMIIDDITTKGEQVEFKINKHDQDKDSIISLRTVYLSPAPVKYSIKFPGHVTNNNPAAPQKHSSFKTVDEIGPEDSLS